MKEITEVKVLQERNSKGVLGVVTSETAHIIASHYNFALIDFKEHGNEIEVNYFDGNEVRKDIIDVLIFGINL